MRCSPSCSAARFTCCEPGTIIPSRPEISCSPSTTRAALRISSIRALVHEPMNTRSTLMSAIAVCGLESHVFQRSLSALRSESLRLGPDQGPRRHRRHHSWVGAPRHERSNLRHSYPLSHRTLRRDRFASCGHCSTAFSHVLALRRKSPAPQVIERRLVGRDHPRAGAAFNAHIADGHARFH